MYHSWYVILIGTIRAFSKKYYVISISYRDFSSVTYTLCLFAFRHNNTKAQCGNYKIFLLLRFYVKSKLANVESLNLHSHTFRGSEFLSLWVFALFEGWNLPNEQNAEPPKSEITTILEFVHPLKGISRKICKTENVWNFHTLDTQ